MKRIPWLLLGALLTLTVSAAEPSFPTLSPGATAPDFKLPGVDGKTYTLKSFKKSSVLVVVFTAPHCPTAQYYEERLKQIVRDYSPRGVALVAINPNNPEGVRVDELGYTDVADSFADMKVRAAQRQFNFPWLYDGDKEDAAHAYGPVATPHVFVFGPLRRLRYAGRIDDDERGDNIRTHDLRDALDALLAGREVAVTETKVFGCSVKWAGKADANKHFLEKLAAEPVSVSQVDTNGLRELRRNDSGKLRLVNFWATWCGPCLKEFPELVEIHRRYRHRAFELVTVAANYPDEEKQVLSFLKKQQASSRNLIFGDRDKYKLMEAFDKGWNAALPYTVLISPTGEVLWKHQGAIDSLELKRMIVKSLKEDRFK